MSEGVDSEVSERVDRRETRRWERDETAHSRSERLKAGGREVFRRSEGKRRRCTDISTNPSICVPSRHI